MATCISPVVAVPKIPLVRNKNFAAHSWPQGCAVDYRVWLNCVATEHLGIIFFTQKVVDVPGLPMISHIHPWASTIVLGGTRWCHRASPLPDVNGGALGEASGTVSFHLCEQGRPQGASFSAGDLSLHPLCSPSTKSSNRVSFGQTAGARMHRQRPHGRDAGAHRESRTILRGIRELIVAVRRRPPAGDGRRGPRHPAGNPKGARAHQGRGSVCRARRDVPAVGPGGFRGA